MCHVLCSGAELKHGQNLGERIDGQPQPEHVLRAAQPGSQFVQLEMRDVQVAEAALMEDLCVPTCASEPQGDGGLTVAEDPFGGGSIQPFGQRREYHGNLVRWGFQTIQGGVASGSERGVAGLTAKRLDALGLAMLAISDQGMDLSIGDPGVRALLIGAGETLGVHSLGCSPAAFPLTPGAYKSTSRAHTQRRAAGETTGSAVKWGAWLKKPLHCGAHSSCL